MSSTFLKKMYNKINMPRLLKNKLDEIDLGNETIGQRISRLRKEKGYTQKELSEKIGIARTLISDYERGKIRIYSGMVARFAIALNVTCDELIGLKNNKNKNNKISLKVIRRLKKIEELTPSKQKVLFTTIDNFLKAEDKI